MNDRPPSNPPSYEPSWSPPPWPINPKQRDAPNGDSGLRERPAPPNGGDGEPLPKLIPIPYIEGETIPQQEWLVEPWIPMDGQTTLFQGDGGDGKTTIGQQLQSSCATALPWLGLRARECVSVGFYTEDRRKDLLRRQAAIDASYNLDCRSTGRMHLFARRDFDNELVVFTRTGAPEKRPFFWQVREAAIDLHARLIVLDVTVDLFGGVENDRRQVRTFARLLNCDLAGAIDGAIFLSAHMSVAGIRSDGGHSGSTDWSNAFRSRLYLSRPKKDNSQDGDEPPDTDARLLTRKKANFARIGETIKLHWSRGVILPDEFTSSPLRRPVEDVFMALLDAHEGANRKPLSESINAPNYAPRVFARMPASERDGYSEADFKRALESLFRTRKIVSLDYGRKGDERKKIARKNG